MKLPKFFFKVIFTIMLAQTPIIAADATFPWVFDGEYWGAETNGLKAGVYIQHSITNQMNSTRQPIAPVVQKNKR